MIEKEYCDLAILFGYLTMFSTVKPIITCIAWLYLFLKLQYEIRSYSAIYNRKLAKDIPNITEWS